jgi:hypothetical protein
LRRILLAKLPEHYAPQFEDEAVGEPYYWPV